MLSFSAFPSVEEVEQYLIQDDAEDPIEASRTLPDQQTFATLIRYQTILSLHH